MKHTPEGNNHFKCEVNTPGTKDWDVQLRSIEFDVDESCQYQVEAKKEE